MKSRLAFGVLALVLLSSAALAEGCRGGADLTASCAEGMVWDMAKGVCVERPSS